MALDGADYLLTTEDALYYAGGCTHAFANAGEAECVYYTAMHVAGFHHIVSEVDS